MKPFIVISDLKPEIISRWDKCFINSGREFSHSMWFRTQEEQNRKYSNWESPSDMRRRLIQFYDEYGVINGNFCIKNIYLWLSLAFPQGEIDRYVENINTKLVKSNWINKGENIWEKGGLTFFFERAKTLQEDIQENRLFPKDYDFLTITVRSENFDIPKNIRTLPWKLFNQGLREQDKRGNPEYIKDVSKLKEYLPAQIELGCGPSIESGIDPLYSYHSLYSVQNHKTKKFILSPDDDRILYLLIENHEKYCNEVSLMYKEMLLAKPTLFYQVLKKLIDQGLIVEPILNNNFDGLCEQLDIQSIFVRDYTKYFRFKDYDFNPEAKSLWVIGSHADRRLLQKIARKKGLKIVYIDPERFVESGEIRAYPLEGPQSGDLVLNMSAEKFTEDIRKFIN